MTGVERYASEVLARFTDRARVIAPSRPADGLRGHAWEQLVLPRLAGREALLWSPANTGPLAVRRQVVTIHDVSPLDHPEWFERRFAAWYRWLLPRLARRVRRIITDSVFSKARIVDRLDVPEEHVVPIACGVAGRFAPATPDAVEAVRARHALGRPYVLTVGSLQPRKNLPALFDAWTRLRRTTTGGLDLDLVVAGAGRANFRSRGLAAVPDGVRLMGFVDDEELPALYTGALCVVLPSRYEGFGLTALEAMACGTPLVIAAGTATSEVTGGAALEVDAASGEAIAGAIERLRSDEALRAALGRRGRDQARPYTWDRTAGDVWRVLEEAAGDA